MSTEITIFKRKQIGESLQQRRVQLRLSKYNIAQRTNLSITQITQIEKGASSFTIDSALDYANALEMQLILS